MKLNKRCGMLVAALASIGMGSAVVFAQSSDTTTGTGTGTTGTHHHADKSSTQAHEGGMHGHPMLVGATLRATRQLNLTAAQKTQIKTIMDNAHQQAKANMAEHTPDMSVLGDPSNPGYSAAIQQMKTSAANRIQQESDVQSQIVNVLTPEQKAKLPTVLASMQTKHEAHRAAAGEQHSGMR
jgi:Spy/CpxP family protein refolding chaperone